MPSNSERLTVVMPLDVVNQDHDNDSQPYMAKRILKRKQVSHIWQGARLGQALSIHFFKLDSVK